MKLYKIDKKTKDVKEVDEIEDIDSADVLKIVNDGTPIGIYNKADAVYVERENPLTDEEKNKIKDLK